MKCDECRYLVYSSKDILEAQRCTIRQCFPDPCIERECEHFECADRLQKLRRLPAEKVTDLLIYPIEKHGNLFFFTRDGEVFASYNQAFDHTSKWLSEPPDKHGFY